MVSLSIFFYRRRLFPSFARLKFHGSYFLYHKLADEASGNSRNRLFYACPSSPLSQRLTQTLIIIYYGYIYSSHLISFNYHTLITIRPPILIIFITIPTLIISPYPSYFFIPLNPLKTWKEVHLVECIMITEGSSYERRNNDNIFDGYCSSSASGPSKLFSQTF